MSALSARPALRCVVVTRDDGDALRGIRVLFREYQQLLESVGCEIGSFQDFERELTELPGRYAADRSGVMLLVCHSGACAGATRLEVEGIADQAGAEPDSTPPGSGREPDERGDAHREAETAPFAAACVGLKRIGDGVAEIKRLYVRPAFRRFGLGRALTVAIEREAKRLGYREVKLDSLERLPAAVRLYESCGFGRIDPYVHNPLPDAVFLGKQLPSP